MNQRVTEERNCGTYKNLSPNKTLRRGGVEEGT